MSEILAGTHEDQCRRQLPDIAEAFLRYFNPMELASDKEAQWWALYDAIEFYRLAQQKDRKP